jgi:hypothetical protein
MTAKPFLVETALGPLRSGRLEETRAHGQSPCRSQRGQVEASVENSAGELGHALRDCAVRPDGNNLDNDDELRRSLFDAMFENRVWVAERKVPENKVED